MATSDYAEWLQRGRTHMRAGRPIDAVLCFRRAAYANPREVDARFHLGEMLWQLGLSDEAIAAWRDAAQIEPRFLAARLALAEGLLSRADYAGAQAAASDALALAPLELRARASHECGRGGAGRSRSTGEARQALVRESRTLAAACLYTGAGALARARATRRVAGRPRGAIGAESGNAAVVPAGADRNRRICARPGGADGCAARAHLATQTKSTRCAGSSSQSIRMMLLWRWNLLPPTRRCAGRSRLTVPSGWRCPHRRRGRAPCMARPGAGHAVVCVSVRNCAGNGAEIGDRPIDDDHRLRRQRGTHARRRCRRFASRAEFREIPSHPDATHARALGGQRSGRAGRPGRNARCDWAFPRRAPGARRLVVGFGCAGPCTCHWSSKCMRTPMHSPKGCANCSPDRFPRRRAPVNWRDGGMPRCGRISRAMSDAAAAGYARVLAAQPDYAPAHRLSAVLARDRGDRDEAEREFARAVVLAPDDVGYAHCRGTVRYRFAPNGSRGSRVARRSGANSLQHSVMGCAGTRGTRTARRRRRRAGVRPGPAIRAGGRADPISTLAWRCRWLATSTKRCLHTSARWYCSRISRRRVSISASSSSSRKKAMPPSPPTGRR